MILGHVKLPNHKNTNHFSNFYKVYLLVKSKLTLHKGLVAVAKLLAFHALFADMDAQNLITLTFKLPILYNSLLSSSNNTSFNLFSYHFLEQKSG